MSFPASTGILLPEEFDVVHRVFSEVSAADWFTRSEERREQFAAMVIDAYRRGISDPETLSLHCRSLAEAQFGNGGIVP